MSPRHLLNDESSPLARQEGLIFAIKKALTFVQISLKISSCNFNLT